MAEVLQSKYQSLQVTEFYDGLLIAHGGRDIGNADPRFSDADEVRRARAVLTRAVNAQQTYVMRAKGGADFTDLHDPNHPNIEPENEFTETSVVGDGLITAKTRTGLMLNTADCVPLAVYQPEQRLLALIHLGWKGAAARLHVRMLNYLTEAHGFDPRGAAAYLGPSVHKESYVTDSLSPQQATDHQWQARIEQGAEGFHVDIPGFVIDGLTAYGIPKQRIECSPVDTGASSDYFSLVRHKQYGEPIGRNGFVAAMTE